MNWFYSKGSQQMGPVSEEQLKELIRSGELNSDALVWEASFGNDWKAVKDLPEFAVLLNEPAAQIPEPESVSTVATPDSSARPDVYEPAVETTGQFPGGAEFTRRSRAALSGKWGISVGVSLIYLVITMVVGQFPFGSLIITGPLFVGYSYFFIRLIRRQTLEVDQLFKGFSSFWNALGVYLLSTIFILLWTLLLIVPGIIAMFAYAQIYFLLADHPELSPMDAIRSSKSLMDGRKGDLFLLRLRFLGWMILGAFTLGIAWLWIYPYWMAAEAAFYQELRDRQPRS